MISIIDYGAGNIRSVLNAINHLGYEAQITSQPAEILRSEIVFFPGVGAAGDTMASLRKLGLTDVIHRLAADNKPLFGICIGLQVLFTGTEEGGWHECLNIIPGRVKKLPPGPKVPHMGWNQVHWQMAHPVFAGVPDGSDLYFVHSYYGTPEDKSVIAGVTEYGISFSSVIVRGNLIATQFHPEKSGDLGLLIYDNFIRWAGGSKC
jgi:imidazole glycerol-phosphate synthase subunit HisH